MVNRTAQSLIAQYLDADDQELAAEFGKAADPRQVNRHREQQSSARFATESRYSRRRRPKAIVPRGPRRRSRQPSGL
jgi:hypothetical protein